MSSANINITRDEGRKEAIMAATRRLAAARRWEESASAAVEHAREQLSSARDEVREAELFLRDVSDTGWENIDADDDDAKKIDEGGKRGGEKRKRARASDDAGASRKVIASEASAPTSKDGVTSTSAAPGEGVQIQEITVEGAGTPEANGTYRLRESGVGLLYISRDYPVYSRVVKYKGREREYVIYRHDVRRNLRGGPWAPVWYVSYLRPDSVLDLYRNGRVVGARGGAGGVLPPRTGWTTMSNGTAPEPELKW